MMHNTIIENLKIKTYIENSLSVIVMVPLTDLDMKLSYKFQDFLLSSIHTMVSQQQLFIDLINVSYIASAGVGALSSALVAAKNQQIQFYICNLNPKVRTVFDILGLMTYFTEKNPDDSKL